MQQKGRVQTSESLLKQYGDSLLYDGGINQMR